MRPDEEGYYDPRDYERGHGNIVNGSAKLVAWIMGIFGTVMTVLMTLVLQAVYSNSGDTRELKGEVAIIQAEFVELLKQRLDGHERKP